MTSTGRLRLVPTTLRAANAFVAQHHRHLPGARGCVCCIGVEVGGELRGVAVIGRPTGRVLQDGYTAEVTRCCTDGTPNAPSALYGAAWRAVRALGYRRLTTYTLTSEPGTSLRAAGFKRVGTTTGGTWSRPYRPRTATHSTKPKVRWERTT